MAIFFIQNFKSIKKDPRKIFNRINEDLQISLDFRFWEESGYVLPEINSGFTLPYIGRSESEEVKKKLNNNFFYSRSNSFKKMRSELCLIVDACFGVAIVRAHARLQLQVNGPEKTTTLKLLVCMESNFPDVFVSIMLHQIALDGNNSVKVIHLFFAIINHFCKAIIRENSGLSEQFVEVPIDAVLRHFFNTFFKYFTRDIPKYICYKAQGKITSGHVSKKKFPAGKFIIVKDSAPAKLMGKAVAGVPSLFPLVPWSGGLGGRFERLVRHKKNSAVDYSSLSNSSWGTLCLTENDSYLIQALNGLESRPLSFSFGLLEKCFNEEILGIWVPFLEGSLRATPEDVANCLELNIGIPGTITEICGILSLLPKGSYIFDTYFKAQELADLYTQTIKMFAIIVFLNDNFVYPEYAVDGRCRFYIKSILSITSNKFCRIIVQIDRGLPKIFCKHKATEDLSLFLESRFGSDFRPKNLTKEPFAVCVWIESLIRSLRGASNNIYMILQLTIWIDCYTNGRTIILPIDATGSCIQIVGALCKDPVLLNASNLRTGGKKLDIFFDPYEELVGQVLFKDHQIPRKAIKSVVITSTFGASVGTASRSSFFIFDKKIRQLPYNVVRVIIERYYASFSQDRLDFLKKLKKFAAAEHQLKGVFIWQLRDSPDIHIKYYKIKKLVIKFGYGTVTPVYPKSTYYNKPVSLEIDDLKFSTSFLANLVHYSDARCIAFTVFHTHSRGRKVLCIHDCFLVRAGIDTQVVKDNYNRSIIDLITAYDQHPVVSRFYKECSIPSLPYAAPMLLFISKFSLI